MKVRVFLVAAMAAVGLLAFAPRSWAGFQVCNRSHETASVAIGYNSQDYGWMSEGWWIVRPHRCETIISGHLNNRYYYVYAEGDNGGVWAADRDQEGGFFCVRKGKFTARNDDFKSGNTIDCEKGGETTKHFVTVDIHNADDFRYNLTQ